MEKKQQKDKYLRGKVPQPKTTEIYSARKIEKKQHKDEYLTGKVLQLNTTQKKKDIGQKTKLKER